MQDKFKKRLAIAIIVAEVVLIISLCISLSDDTMPKSDNIPDVSVAGDNGYSELPENEVVVQAVTGLCFRADATGQEVDIPNQEQNTYCFTVTLYLGDGTLLYKSPMVQPGDCITSIQLLQPLSDGVYQNSVMAYRFYSADDSHSVVSQCEFPIEIRCVN